MLVILDSYELNSLSRRMDDDEPGDLTRAEVISNSLRFSEDRISSALETVLASDKLLFLDLRPRLNRGIRVALGNGERRPHPADNLPELVLPQPESFRYTATPIAKAAKTYRLEYLVSRLSREPQLPTEEEIRGQMHTIQPAPELELLRSSIECEQGDLRKAVELLSAPANGSLLWLQITLHDDGFYSGLRTRAHSMDFAEPSMQPTEVER